MDRVILNLMIGCQEHVTHPFHDSCRSPTSILVLAELHSLYLSTCRLISFASLWVEIKPIFSHSSSQSFACDSVGNTCFKLCFPGLFPCLDLHLSPPACLDSLVVNLGSDLDYVQDSACLLIMDWLWLLFILCSEPRLSLDRSAYLPTAGTCILYLVHTYPNIVVYKTQGQPSTRRPACLMEKEGTINEEHSSQL